MTFLSDAISISPPASERVAIERWRLTGAEAGSDKVAVEAPIALAYNGVSHTVMLASPTDLEDFALGFSLTEGIIDSPRQLHDLEIETRADGIIVQMTIAAERFVTLQTHRRSMAGRTGCGLCGADSLEQVVRDLPAVSAGTRFTPAALQRASADLGGWQSLQRETGATHAAAWIDRTGTILAAREDVGRHNALDKLIGALALARTDFSLGGVLVTSRASYEMVQKTVAAGAGLLAAVSAPTALAIRCAEAWNLTVIGFLRPGSHVTYSHGWRMSEEGAP
jgi:FdhD protein